jgi:hypothetical protein
MSTLPENELDLEKLFLPAWAQEPPAAKQYAHYEGTEDRSEPREYQRGRRPPRRDGRSDDRLRANRPPGGPRKPSRRPDERKSFSTKERPSFRRDEPRERREPPPPLPEINTSFVPDERGVESLARQIRNSGRAYPLFDIARLILQKPERYSVMFALKKKPDGQPAQPLFLCALDDSLWLSQDEAVAHVLRHHFGTFYQAERTPTEPPKGKYTFVAQCGMSGVILGPPNYHDYQNQLRKLHAERFSRMPFEVFKSRVKIVRDEQIVKKWIEDQSSKTEYVCLNMPEPVRLDSREAVEKHFREVHKDNIVKSVESHTLTGVATRSLRSHELTRLVRQLWEEQKRFPLQIATVLSQQFAGHGLQFFKVNKAITHVSVARPHFLDLETTPVSDGVKRIVDFINAHPKGTRRLLVEALAPAPPAPAAPAPPAEPASGESGSPPAATPTAVTPTPEQTAVISDLHWLIHQGHVIEFANGILETAKKPLPKPPKPEKKQAQPPAGATGIAATTESSVPEESTASPVVDAEQPAGAEAATIASEVGSSNPDFPASAEATPGTPTSPAGARPETPAASAESAS